MRFKKKENREREGWNRFADACYLKRLMINRGSAASQKNDEYEKLSVFIIAEVEIFEVGCLSTKAFLNEAPSTF